ncbi:hypothetical protein [Veronia pacifica]|uniref:Uncharacterized protein n=1 Tax=Veronia pacifica TaxID=1080227 RepID=A0A1C3EKT1_9GAMM|nr:hypothetical protein [Veronia pacifica]ODA33842.1 hypothetical protein A8L45_08420 [Veronia pacifica]
MIGFVSALSASLAIIILVTISALIGYIESIFPTHGLIKVDETKYRYVMKGYYVDEALLREVIIAVDNLGLTEKVGSYQTGCNYGFNTSEREMTVIPTFNYVTLNQYFAGAMPIDSITVYEELGVINTCFIDINLGKRISTPAVEEEVTVPTTETVVEDGADG